MKPDWTDQLIPISADEAHAGLPFEHPLPCPECGSTIKGVPISQKEGWAMNDKKKVIYEVEVTEHPEFGTCFKAVCPDCGEEIKKFELMRSYNVLTCRCPKEWSFILQAVADDAKEGWAMSVNYFKDLEMTAIAYGIPREVFVRGIVKQLRHAAKKYRTLESQMEKTTFLLETFGKDGMAFRELMEEAGLPPTPKTSPENTIPPEDHFLTAEEFARNVNRMAQRIVKADGFTADDWNKEIKESEIPPL
jgi:hypothetical protein